MARFAVLALCTALPAVAADTWSDPFSGGRLLHRVTASQDLWVLQVDLCTGGIDVQTTTDPLKGRVVSSFGAAVGAAAAINGDFFSPSFSTDGPAVGDGVAWGAGRDHTYVAPISFADHTVDIPHHNNEGGPIPGARNVVSGHPTLLDDAEVVGNPGDPLCTNRHPRTAIGVSRDHRTLILAVVDGRRSGAAGMTCPELAGLMAEHGAFDAVNMDGGGSSTMVVGGAVKNRPSDGQQRVVGNHLGIIQRGGTDAPLCPERPPAGVVDVADCDAGVVGWAVDGDNLLAPVDVHVYVGGPAGSGAPGFAITANQRREDLCAFLGCDHGFAFPIPPGFRDQQPREVFVYGIDIAGPTGVHRGNPLLQNAPRTLQCAPAPLPTTSSSRRRHVRDQESLAAWSRSAHDVAVVEATVVDAVVAGPGWPAAPRLVRGSDDPAIFVVDEAHGVRRHVVDLPSFAAWGFSVEGIVVDDAAIASLPAGPELPTAPILFRAGNDPAVYVLDVEVEGPDPTDGADPVGPGDQTAPPPPSDGTPAGRTIEVAPRSGCSHGGAGILPVALWLLGWRRRRR